MGKDALRGGRIAVMRLGGFWRAGGIRRLAGGGRRIALTFDDGPSNETPRFLELLDRLAVPATFFVCGKNVARRPAAARAVVEAGHAVGNHTYSHPVLPVRGRRRIREEIARTQRVIEEATGARPGLFRAPYGLGAPALAPVLADLGLRRVHWTVIGNDWKRRAPKIAARVLAAACPGAIVCLHDGRGARPEADRSETLRAVREIIHALRAEGYAFTALDGRGPGR